MTTSTPWGKAQNSKVYVRGVTFFSTASHGGFRVSARQNEKIPEALRNVDGWYEEDCESAKVMFSFPELFPDCQEDAKNTLRHYFPDGYEAVTGEIIPEQESYVKAKRAFWTNAANKYVVVAAWGDWAEDCPKDYVIGCARLGGHGAEKYFLIPVAEYRGRDKNGFVIENPKKYKELHEPSLKSREI